MPDWAKDLLGYGPLGVFAAAVCYAAFKFLGKCVLLAERYVVSSESLSASLKANSEAQSQCLQEIKVVLIGHDQHANSRSECVEKLLELHLDPTIPHGTAMAIHNVSQLKLAAMCACNGCREAMATVDEPVRDIVIRKCDEIEQILKSTV